MKRNYLVLKLDPKNIFTTSRKADIIIMKKFIIYIVSMTLVFGMMIPFIEQANAQDTIDEVLELSNEGKTELELTKKDQTISMTLTNKKENEVKIQLPKGLVYTDSVDGITYDEETKQLLIEEKTSKIDFKLDLTVKELTEASLIFYATMMMNEEETTSNDFVITVIEEHTVKEDNEKEDKTDVKEDAVVANSKISNKTSNKIATPTVNQEDLTPEETIGSPWTTKPGVQAAPKPDVITHAEGTNEVNVNTWVELSNAMQNANINVIHIQDDFYNPAITGNLAYVTIPMRNIKVNGNGHTVDFGATSFRQNTMIANSDIEWEMNHLTIYGRNYYSVMTSTGTIPRTSTARMIFDNVSYVGSQISANFTWLTDFRGHVESHSVNNYIRPFDGTSINTQANEMNLQVTDVLFSKNSYYHGTTENAGVFILLTKGNMLAEENSEVILTAGGAAGGGEYGYYLMNVTGDSVKLKKNAHVTLNAKEAGSMRAISLGADSTIEADEGAVLNVNGRGPSGGYHLIDLGLRSKINIKEGAELNINSKNKGNGLGDLINASASAEFLIGKKATFDAKSDGTGNHNILDFGTNSLFKFADAEKVNLQFTNDSINANAKMFSMSGTANTLDVDVQEIKAWNRDSFSTNNTRDPEYHWTPMFGMKTQITTSASKVLEAHSVLNTERNSYINDFKPEKFSRLLYSYIDDVRVGILNTPTDDVNSVNSKVIKGVANPGALVRLTGDNALPKATIPSGIDGSDNEEITGNYTIKANDSGEFTVHAREGQTFTASKKITAYAFMNGKADSTTVEVLDETAPTAEGIDLTMIFGEELPKAEYFIVNPKDSNPSNKGFTYTFKEDYTNLSEQEGKHSIIIIVADTAGNKVEILVELTVTKDGYGIKADDFTVELSALKKFDTANKLNAFLLQESKASAFGILENESIDLTEHIAVTNLDSLDQMKAGKYTITLSFDLTDSQPGATATRKFTVTVLNDEAVKPTNPEKPGQVEPEETENDGTGQTGLLKLDYAPSNFDFGKVKFGFDNVKTNAIKTTSSKQWLQVSDDRAEDDISNWSVQVAQQQELTSKKGNILKGAKIQVPAGELYNEHTGEEAITTGQLNTAKIDITTTPQTIFHADNSNEKMKNISTNVWNTENVTLSIPGGQEATFENYSNSITWTLVVEPK